MNVQVKAAKQMTPRVARELARQSLLNEIALIRLYVRGKTNAQQIMLERSLERMEELLAKVLR